MNRLLSKKNKALLAELVRTDFKLRYEGSALGYAWSLLRPLFIFLILYVVFVKFLKFGAGFPHFPLYLLLGIVLWNFFVEITNQSLTAIVGRADLIRKIRVPRWIIILSSSFSALINLALNLVVIAIFMIFTGAEIQKYAIIMFPLLVFELYLFGLGCSLFLSAIYVKYRDVKYIWDVLLQAGFYATPIIYTLNRIPNEQLQKLLLLSPVSQTIQGARYTIISSQTITTNSIFNGGYYSLIPIFAVVIILVTGIFYFRSESRSFAENI